MRAWSPLQFGVNTGMQRRKKRKDGVPRKEASAASAAPKKRDGGSPKQRSTVEASDKSSSAAEPVPLDDAITNIAKQGQTRRTGARAPQKKKRAEQKPAKRTARRIADRTTPVAGTPSVQVEGHGSEPLQPEDLSEIALRSAPAWLVSLIVHTMLLLILGLLYVSQQQPDIITLDATYAEHIGEQLDNETLASDALEPSATEEPVFSVDNNPANDPLASPPNIERNLTGMMASDTFEAPSVGIALTGREPGMKKALLAAYGGTATTEAAVNRALEWLKRNQRRDGLWSLTGPYSQGTTDENRVAATAMALLAFQGAGHTHNAGRFHEEVRKGWRALLKKQDRDGNFFYDGPPDQRLYSQAQVMIALCEIYAMTKDSKFKKPAQKAVDYAVSIQAPAGGWRYIPRKDSDTSVTGWFVMGLQSALMAGLEVPSPTLQRVSKFLDSVAVYGGAFYKYQPIRKEPGLAMTAEGLLCRQYLGWKHDDPRLREGVDFLLENPINRGEVNSYYWYYATQVMHHMEGDAWNKWNNVMRDWIPKHQIKSGRERGSWDPNGDRWGAFGGRLYHTCLCTYILEVYYRHLPIYSYRMQ